MIICICIYKLQNTIKLIYDTYIYIYNIAIYTLYNGRHGIWDKICICDSTCVSELFGAGLHNNLLPGLKPNVDVAELNDTGDMEAPETIEEDMEPWIN